jgi:DnaJ-class molecular chaperone
MSENIVNKILSSTGRTHSVVHKILGKDTHSEDKRTGETCKRCKGKKTIKLGKNVIECPVCKGKGVY